jgi:hypothetical protein
MDAKLTRLNYDEATRVQGVYRKYKDGFGGKVTKTAVINSLEDAGMLDSSRLRLSGVNGEMSEKQFLEAVDHDLSSLETSSELQTALRMMENTADDVAEAANV